MQYSTTSAKQQCYSPQSSQRETLETEGGWGGGGGGERERERFSHLICASIEQKTSTFLGGNYKGEPGAPNFYKVFKKVFNLYLACVGFCCTNGHRIPDELE